MLANFCRHMPWGCHTLQLGLFVKLPGIVVMSYHTHYTGRVTCISLVALVISLSVGSGGCFSACLTSRVGCLAACDPMCDEGA